MKAVILFLCLTTSLYAGAIKHTRIIWHDSPQNENIVAWNTDKKKKDSYIYIDVQSRNGNILKYAQKIKAKTKLIIGTFDFVHYVRFTELTPDTTYYFAMTSGDHVSKEFHFKTAPAKGANFKLVFGGDSRSDRKMRRHMNRLIGSHFEKNPDLYGLVHGGDYVANGHSWKQWKAWLDDYQLTTTSAGRLLPIVPTRGNHESLSPIFNSIWVRPGDKIYKNYYHTVIGDLSIITLNTNISHSGKQKKWLKKTLPIASETSSFIVPNYHRPAWPGVKKEGRAKKHWVPLFEKHHVDLVFESDGHVLKRTAPIFQDQINHEVGITYVGEGGLGVPQRVAKKKDEWYFRSPGYAVSNQHFMQLSVSPNKMNLSVILKDGTVFDSFDLPKKNRTKLMSRKEFTP